MQSKWLIRQVAKSAQASKGILNLIKALEDAVKAAIASQGDSHSSETAESKNEKEYKAEDSSDEVDIKPQHRSEKNTEYDVTTEMKMSESGGCKNKSHDESFLSDAEGHGSIAEVIGRT